MPKLKRIIDFIIKENPTMKQLEVLTEWCENLRDEKLTHFLKDFEKLKLK
jgi:hypothetical protein